MKLKEARKAANLTQAEVAAYVGINQNTYSYWENEKTKIDNRALQKLANLFNCSIDYLLDRENYSENMNPIFSKDEEEMLKKYRQLDADGKKLINVMLDTRLKQLEKNHKTEVI